MKPNALGPPGAFSLSKPMPRLHTLLPYLSNLIAAPAGDVEVQGIAFDSRQVRPGDVFVAFVGFNQDVHAYIPDAIGRGASAVVGTRDLGALPVPYVQVADGRLALAELAAVLQDFPARQLTMIGITGTDGKTTTTNLLYQVFLAAGLPAGMISTVNAVIGDQVLDTGFHVTTPDAPHVQAYLAEMVRAGLSHVVLETTSHGWAQQRVAACEFDIGVITNITHEHLNDHGSFESYRAAKARLFTSLAETGKKEQGNPRLAVLNRDDSSYAYLAPLTAVRQVSYGLHPAAEIRAENLHFQPAGITFEALGPGWRVPVSCRLAGAFNVSNCLAALTAAVAGLEIEPEVAAAGIANLAGIPGRMEHIDLGQDFTAIVDFAHTPNALQSALETARQMTSGRVIVAFGSAGLRDRQKRRMMAEVAAELADVSVFTAEDPRTESLEGILAEMAAGADSRGGVEGQSYWRVPDRGQAIRFAISQAQAGDIVLACGKGHEQSMCFEEIEHPWDDRIAMRAALSEHLGLPGPSMPYLPTQEYSETS
ncbi:MAG: UDP-N-acetylmuramoyl-L-alanyl-D-glutamate--2,6-diaminopimelate ligase [Anaerolineales bacterium]|nr:UDP-N-acetylmuramoyl-L-alanyl-D-glutamate--2,6-diaminopimelate ligase [Anaerolineales bacterium]